MRVPKIRKAPQPEWREIHPEGTFDAKLVEWGDVRRARSGMHWFMTARLETEHGLLFSTYGGFPNTLMLLRSLEQELKAKPLKVRVRHRSLDGVRVFAEADIILEFE